MRSEQVYLALGRVPNRFTLCQLTAKAAKRLHIAQTRTEETISRALADESLCLHHAPMDSAK
jgi:hypothetical protein